VVVVLAVVARAAVAGLLLPADGMRREEPSVIAANINAGRGFVMQQYGTIYYALKEPAHIAFLALFTRLLGDRDLPLLALQALLGAAAAIAAAFLARRLTADATVGLVAGGLVALNPFLVYYDSLIVHPLSLDTCLFLITTAVNVRAVTAAGQTFTSAAVAGLVTGLALWQRSPLLFTGGTLWVASVAVTPRGHRRQLVRAAVFVVVALAVVQPWFARNYAHLGRWVYTTDTAHIIWLGNNPLSNGTYSDEHGQRIFYRADPAFRATIEGASELEQTDRFLAAVTTFVREQPARAASLVAGRVWAFGWFAPNAGAEYRPWQVRLYSVIYVGLLVLGGAGAVRFFRDADADRRREGLLVCASLLGLVAVHALTAINMKHRVPLEMMLSIFAAVPATAALRAFRPFPA
jgi:hypothetical protein